MSSLQSMELVDSPASLFLSTTGVTGLIVAAMMNAFVEAMVAPCSNR